MLLLDEIVFRTRVWRNVLLLLRVLRVLCRLFGSLWEGSGVCRRGTSILGRRKGER